MGRGVRIACGLVGSLCAAVALALIIMQGQANVSLGAGSFGEVPCGSVWLVWKDGANATTEGLIGAQRSRCTALQRSRKTRAIAFVVVGGVLCVAGGLGGRRRGKSGPWLAAVVVASALLGACGSGNAGPPGSKAPSSSQLAEARRLIDPLHHGGTTKAEDDCVARTVVENPTMDILANDMAQIQNGDLRQAVMTAYLECAYNFVLDLYMRFAPAGYSAPQLACMRSLFTQLEVGRLAEVMVLDPDAEFTGPLVIHACTSGEKINPLFTATIPNTGS